MRQDDEEITEVVIYPDDEDTILIHFTVKNMYKISAAAVIISHRQKLLSETSRLLEK